mgnify:CR=1 FL=1
MTKNRKPLNKRLYEKVKAEAKKKFDVWPSAYASAWLVREYQKRGGKYDDRGLDRSETDLARWFEEKWIDVCQLPNIVSCGRPKTSPKTWKKNYPYCRPSKRVNSRSPKPYTEYSRKELKRRCSRKRRSPLKRLKSKSRRRSRS